MYYYILYLLSQNDLLGRMNITDYYTTYTDGIRICQPYVEYKFDFAFFFFFFFIVISKMLTPEVFRIFFQLFSYSVKIIYSKKYYVSINCPWIHFRDISFYQNYVITVYSSVFALNVIFLCVLHTHNTIMMITRNYRYFWFSNYIRFDLYYSVLLITSQLTISSEIISCRKLAIR